MPYYYLNNSLFFFEKVMFCHWCVIDEKPVPGVLEYCTRVSTVYALDPTLASYSSTE